MGFFNHLFGGKEAIAIEGESDKQKRLVLWEELKVDYVKRESLVKFFNFANIGKALGDSAGLYGILIQLEKLISRDLINIEGEEKTDEEIMADLLRLTSNESSVEAERWGRTLQKERDKYDIVMAILRKLHDILKLELHTIRLIKSNLANAKNLDTVSDLLLLLFKLVYHKEGIQYNILAMQAGQPLGDEIKRIVRAILLEEEFKRVEKADTVVRARVKKRIEQEQVEEHVQPPTPLDLARTAALEQRKQVERERRLNRILAEFNAILNAEFHEEAQRFALIYKQVTSTPSILGGRTSVTYSDRPAFSFFLVPINNPLGNGYEIMCLTRPDLDARVKISEIRAFYALVSLGRRNIKKGILHFTQGNT